HFRRRHCRSGASLEIAVRDGIAMASGIPSCRRRGTAGLHADSRQFPARGTRNAVLTGSRRPAGISTAASSFSCCKNKSAKPFLLLTKGDHSHIVWGSPRRGGRVVKGSRL